MAGESKETDEQRILIAGGGTGGHVNPALAIARELQRRRPDRSIRFVGTAAGLESRLVPAAGYPLETIRAAGVVGKGPVGRIRGLVRLALGCLDSRRLLRRTRPHLVIGVGGYASAPVVLAAILRRVPTMIHEQNRFPGMTNRVLSPLVGRTAVSFPGTAGGVGRRGEVTGNPVRPEFTRIPVWRPHDGPARLLVFGGSRGARAINDAMVAALGGLPPDLAITHQTGPADRDRVAAAYAVAGREARVEAYLDDMAAVLEGADLVICRAGASTLAELAAAGRAAILIPFPRAAHDHQRHNARSLVEAGAARCIDPRELDGERLARTIRAVLEAPGELERMSGAARRLARPDAAGRIADLAEALMRRAA